MFYLILCLVCGVSFAPLVFPKLDIWHAQGLWVQGGLMLLFSYSFFEKPKQVFIKNKSLGLLHAWVGLSALISFWVSMGLAPRGVFNPNNLSFYAYFNFLCLVFLYRFIVEYLGRGEVEKILIGLKRAIQITVFVCLLQIWGLSQFFAVAVKHSHLNNLVTGFLGNGTHLSGFLACMIPLFLWKAQREDWLTIIAILLILFFSGTSIGDPSISGFAIATIILGIYFFIKNKVYFTVFCVALILITLGITIVIEDKAIGQFTSGSGRIEMWKYYWPLFEQGAVTGHGLGKINQIYRMTPYFSRHLHLEPFHFAFELGIIGLLLIINLVYEFFKKEFDDDLKRSLGLGVLAFCISCLFNFPAHLWLPSTIAMFMYASIFALENEEKNAQF